MTRVWTIAIALCIGAFGVYGCDEEETPEDKLTDDLDVFEDEQNEQVDVVCDCWQEFTYGQNAVQYPNKDACKTGQGEILPARRRCIDDAFQQDVSVSQQWLDCVLPLEREYTDCINSKLTCMDATSISACDSDYNTGYDRCLTLPNSVQRDYEDCF
ncbi:MAG: hypothetical protein AAF721_02055 [Myxococcota bacterium]